MIILYEFFDQIQKYTDDLDKFMKKTKGENILWSPKIDGVRCLIEVNKQPSDIKYYSANGKLISNFKSFDSRIIELGQTLNKYLGLEYPIKLDCEAASKDRFVHIMTQLRRLEDINPDIFELNLFDIPSIGEKPFIDRHNILKEAILRNPQKDIKLLPYETFDFINTDKLNKLVNQMHKKGYEGVVLQSANATYNAGKRVTFGVKVKKYNTVDLKVVDIELGKKGSRIEAKLASFIVEYKGKKLNISGKLSDKDREYYAKNPPIGQFIEVKYKEETSSGYLIEPIFVRLRLDK